MEVIDAVGFLVVAISGGCLTSWGTLRYLAWRKREWVVTSIPNMDDMVTQIYLTRRGDKDVFIGAVSLFAATYWEDLEAIKSEAAAKAAQLNVAAKT